MTKDAFSKCHPAVNFLFFLGAIGFGVMIQHPAYLAAGVAGAAVYYLLLKPFVLSIRLMERRIPSLQLMEQQFYH